VINQKLLDDVIANSSRYGYTKDMFVDGKPFSFDKHNYLVGIYRETHPHIIIEKSAQMGASVYAIISALFVADKMGKNVIYFFPTDTDVNDFAKTRVAPMIRDSPYLQTVTSERDSLGLRQVNKAWLYFRGMKSNIAMKSIPADYLIFDELDEVTEAQESLADQRLNHSSLRWRLKLSTPTFEGYGIDRQFQKSDMRYWNLICKKCETRNIVEDTFPDCVKRVSDEEAYLICYKCSERLDTQYGIWIPKAPEVTRLRGYHICGLYSEYTDLASIMEEYDSGRRRDEFMRSKLGFPYTPANQRITPGMVRACLSDKEMRREQHCYMGVDQKGDELHIVIRKAIKFTKTHEVVYIGRVREFGMLDQFMRDYNVNLCVIDGTPNQHSARDFSKRFPGRVYLCYYQDTQKGAYAWNDPSENTTDRGFHWEVKVNRTEAIDDMYDEVIRRTVSLPKETSEVTTFVEQLCSLAKVYEEDDDGAVVKAFWKRLGPDHYAHANTYSMIAFSKFGQYSETTSYLAMPRTLGRVIRAQRRYDGGSQF
jgi:hypothetical protein